MHIGINSDKEIWKSMNASNKKLPPQDDFLVNTWSQNIFDVRIQSNIGFSLAYLHRIGCNIVIIKNIFWPIDV